MNQIRFISDQAVKHVRGFQDFLEHGGIHLSGQSGYFTETFIFFRAIVSVRCFSREVKSVKRGPTVIRGRAGMEVKDGGVIADSG
jgi:hypothetical protein